MELKLTSFAIPDEEYITPLKARAARNFKDICITKQWSLVNVDSYELRLLWDCIVMSMQKVMNYDAV